MYTGINKNYDSELFLNDYQPLNSLIQSSTRNVDENSDEAYLEAFLQYSTKFKKEGHQLSADLRYDNSLSDNKTNMRQPRNLSRYRDLSAMVWKG